RLHLADLRVVQPGAAHAAGRAAAATGRLHHRLSGHDGRRLHRQCSRVDPVPVLLPLRHRRRIAQRLERMISSVHPASLARPLLGVAAALALTISLVPAGSAAPEDADAEVSTQNPISSPFSDTYADPAILRGKDGRWYLYATSDPLHAAQSPFGLMHIARTRDFVDWEYIGNVFSEENRPGWATDSSFFWAPDIRYIDGQYVLYYTVTDTVDEPGEWNYAIGAATAPTP